MSKDTRNNLIFFLVGLVLLSWMVYDFGVERLLRELFKVGWWILPIIGLWLVIYILNTSAWNVILGRNCHVRFGKLLSMKITGFALNYLTPVVALAGEPWKVMNVKKLIGVEKASASVILYNMMHILSHFFFWVSAIVLVIFNIKPTRGAYIFLGVLLIIMLWIIAIIYRWYKNGIVFSFMHFLKKLPLLKAPAARILSKEKILTEIENQVVAFYNTRRKAFYYTLGFEYASRLIGSLEFYLIMRALGLNIDILQAVYISAASSLLANIMFFMPLQLGTREGSLYLVYESLRFPPGQGVLVSIVTRIREFFWILLGLLLMKFSAVKSHTTR
ncbi:MAG: UPF0104 family protein [Bacteroidales bacterium]|jgi:hypothetical protein|nr:UPF0104 family protein [Bacteroidales bacterium]